MIQHAIYQAAVLTVIAHNRDTSQAGCCDAPKQSRKLKLYQCRLTVRALVTA